MVVSNNRLMATSPFVDLIEEVQNKIQLVVQFNNY